MKKMITTTFLALSLLTGMAAASAEDSQATAITVWVDGKGQKSMAEEATEKHAEMAKQGWKFQDLDVYVEDGDMKGMFVSYVRDAAPAPTPKP
jgi:maltose-binding protein MalE